MTQGAEHTITIEAVIRQGLQPEPGLGPSAGVVFDDRAQAVGAVNRYLGIRQVRHTCRGIRPVAGKWANVPADR